MNYVILWDSTNSHLYCIYNQIKWFVAQKIFRIINSKSVDKIETLFYRNTNFLYHLNNFKYSTHCNKRNALVHNMLLSPNHFLLNALYNIYLTAKEKNVFYFRTSSILSWILKVISEEYIDIRIENTEYIWKCSTIIFISVLIDKS